MQNKKVPLKKIIVEANNARKTAKKSMVQMTEDEDAMA